MADPNSTYFHYLGGNSFYGTLCEVPAAGSWSPGVGEHRGEAGRFAGRPGAYGRLESAMMPVCNEFPRP